MIKSSIDIQSNQTNEMIEVTDRVQHVVDSEDVTDGIVHLFTPHTTAAITINENADPDVVHDMLNILDRLVPLKGGYLHAEGNSAAHVKSSMFGCSETIPRIKLPYCFSTSTTRGKQAATLSFSASPA